MHGNDFEHLHGRYGWSGRAGLPAWDEKMVKLSRVWLRLFVITAVVLGSAAGSLQAEPYPWRWFFLITNFSSGEQSRQADALVERAARAGLNAVVVADIKFMTLEHYRMGAPRSRYRSNVSRFLLVCQQHGIEVIPYLRSVSRAEGILAYDVNLVAGYEVKDAVFEVRNGIAQLMSDPRVKLADGSFEQHDGKRFTGWGFQDDPGKGTMADRLVKRSGRQSIRLVPAGASLGGMCRLTQEISVSPHRHYRVSAWVKTVGLGPANHFNIFVKGIKEGSWRNLTFDHPGRHKTKPTQGWTRVSTDFNSFGYERVKIILGLWGAKQGRVWVDDVEVEEIGLMNVLRRPGCPLKVAEESTHKVLQEGVDFEPVVDPLLGRAKWVGIYDRDHRSPAIRLHRRVKDGTRLRVDFYHALPVVWAQADCCLTERKVDELFLRQMLRLRDVLGSHSRYMLGLDELRTGGSCAACKATGKTPGQLLAEHSQRFAGIIQQVHPGAEIIVWHDMYDPNHSAIDEHYLILGDLSGSWEGLDREVIVCPWSFKKRVTSLAFFASRGHRQVASANMDEASNPEGYLRQWLASLDQTRGVNGLMYTTWKGDYEKLESFGRLLSDHSRPSRVDEN